MAPTKAEVLRNKRASYQDQLERMLLFVNNDEELAGTSLQELRIRLKTIEKQTSVFESIQSELEGALYNEEAAAIRRDCENGFFIVYAKLSAAIEAATPVPVPVQPQGNQNPNAIPHQQLVKLPNLGLPTFAGEYTKWMSFITRFESSVHNKAGLSNSDKFQYLLSILSGPASQIIDSLEINDQNYNVALNLLKERYENRPIIVQEHIKQIFTVKQVGAGSQHDLRNLIDSIRAHLRALQSLGRPTDQWDDIIIYLIVSKLDADSVTKWRDEAPAERLPSLTDLFATLTRRCQVLEDTSRNSSLCHVSSPVGSSTSTQRTSKARKSGASLVSSSSPSSLPSSSQIGSATVEKCTFCGNSKHNIYRCDNFAKIMPIDRYNEAKRLNVCLNCLKTGHFSKSCEQSGCKVCGAKHNTLLHLPPKINAVTGNECSPSTSSRAYSTSPHPSTASSTLTLHASSLQANSVQLQSIGESEHQINYVFLATAVVNVDNGYGHSYSCRVLLDSGSQLNFISEKMVHQLQLPRLKSEVYVAGVGGRHTNVKHRTFVTIRSRINDFALPLEAHILTKITEQQPDRFIDIQNFAIPEKMPLADPKFNCPQRVDMLIGAEHYLNVLSIGKIGSLLQNTVFGWVVSGRNLSPRKGAVVCHVSNRALVPLDQQVQQFWELEEPIAKSKKHSVEEDECERHYRDTVSRDNTGRYIVRLPFAADPKSLGNSLRIATKRFYNLERKFEQRLELKAEYASFMAEYHRLGHMEEVSLHDAASYYFLPHHSVLKPDSTTTKLRVVFDASAKSEKGNSLNDILMVGPTVQSDIFSLILRFRLWRFVFTADISKMYRQILVHVDDRKYQCILWRSNPSDRLQAYRLNTITYGTSAAPFLATRTLNQLAADYATDYPEASATILADCYVDDIVTGSNSLSELVRSQSQLIEMLGCGGLELRKWCANSDTLLNHLPEGSIETHTRFRDNDIVKTLGLMWEPAGDKFLINISPLTENRVSKRTILADTMRVFDPLGLISPVVVGAKIFLQDLWKLNITWDESLPTEIHGKWVAFRKQLTLLYSLQFRRHVLLENPLSIQIHAFADASEKAYGAVIYLRSIDRSGAVNVSLLCSKTRVAPTKQISLPRVELCAAQLAAQLVDRVRHACQQHIAFERTAYWTDSKIVLAWIAAPAYNWKTFVANRVANIQELSEPQNWHHVRTHENPADLASRGTTARGLIESDLWLNGPEFLRSNSEWCVEEFAAISDPPERRQQKISLVTIESQPDFIDRLKHKNSYKTIIRVVAICYRFVDNIKAKQSNTLGKHMSLQQYNVIDAVELDRALVSCVRYIQQQCFAVELKCLTNGRTFSKRSSISSLNPFVDNNNVIRVGGRLKNASLSYTSKHPILLPAAHSFTMAMIVHYHVKNLHAGPQALLAAIREQFWPINGKQLTRTAVRRCIRCFRTKPLMLNQLMGNLPSERLVPSRPFLNTGIDFMGPIQIHHKIRGKRPTKAYAALFVCFWSKAVHLEVVSDLTTDAFFAAFKRFVGRRGLPVNVYTDNATNFVGAKNELLELRAAFLSRTTQDSINAAFAQDGVTWHTIPPRSPHFGGLWEAAIKSAKYHLKRQLALASLTFEELNTVMIQIEAVLNSRPLTPLTSNPADLSALTAGHFLIGAPLTAAVESKVDDLPLNRVQRWQRINWIHQHFWNRWSREYLHHLQEREKWQQVKTNVTPNMLVLLQEDNIPPLKWPLGRIVEVHTGTDGLVRAVTVRTCNGTYRRAVTRIAVLPETD